MAPVIGKVGALYRTAGADDFVTAGVDALELTLHGIAGARHHGITRGASAREPWLERGFELRNDRQLSAVSADEMAEVAAALKLPSCDPELLGANLLVQGIAGFSRIAPGAILAIGGVWGGEGRFDGTALLKVEGYNRPCRNPGRRLARHFDRPELEFSFVNAARSLRGLVLSVAHGGPVRTGDPVVVIPPLLAP